LTEAGLTELLLSHYKTPVTYNDATRVLKVFFDWCVHKSRRYIETNPATNIDALEEPWLIPEIYTPEEVRRVFRAVQRHDPEFTPVLALGFFAGLRVCEIRRIQASDIDLECRVINIRAEVAKSSGASNPQPRVIEGLPDNVWEWLRVGASAHVKVDCTNFHRRRRKIFQEAGVALRDNAARHSFASYAYAFCGGDELPRKWTGHRIPTAFFKHYAAVVARSKGAEYFTITPDESICSVPTSRRPHGGTKIKWPEPQKLLAEVKKTNFSATARRLGVSDVAIRKYLQKNGLIPSAGSTHCA
ncbi:MAG: tyrosine-type recombinase/integrase, partial [Opitutales bacterium]